MYTENPANNKVIYYFDEGNKFMYHMLGGKGVNLSVIHQLGLPIPYGFIISTLGYRKYNESKDAFFNEFWEQIVNGIKSIEQKTGLLFGNAQKPLLVSVRSGAPVSMPGILTSWLNIGLTSSIAQNWQENNPRFVQDIYSRLVKSYATNLMDFDQQRTNQMLANLQNMAANLRKDGIPYSISEFENDIVEFRKILGSTTFFDDPWEQLKIVISNVFDSWKADKARYYRAKNGISDDIGTAINIQSMVFGNRENSFSGSGVFMTRNPITGIKEIVGEYIPNSQGDDLMSGTHSPLDLSCIIRQDKSKYDEISQISQILVEYWQQDQEVEFTIDNKVLYLLQSRTLRLFQNSGV